MSGPTWQRLGQVAPRELVAARLTLHHAAQLVAAVGKTLLDPEPDDSHPNLGWLPQERALAGHRVPGPQPFRAALRLADAHVLLQGGDDAIVESFSLAGETLESASERLAGAIERHSGQRLPAGLTSPGYELPPHPLAEGAAFELAPAEAFVELAGWFAAADALIGSLARHEKAPEPRCWPHHFDLATLLTEARGADGGATKTVGIGMSPGDDTYPEPYWYVSPWPYPDAAAELAPLPDGGHWHREGFTAAILTGTELVAAADGQSDRLQTFLTAALAASRRALAV